MRVDLNNEKRSHGNSGYRSLEQAGQRVVRSGGLATTGEVEPDSVVQARGNYGFSSGARTQLETKVCAVMDIPRLKRIANQVRALREITAVSGTITKRAQGELLQSLSSEELTFVAEELMEGKNNNGFANGTERVTK